MGRRKLEYYMYLRRCKDCEGIFKSKSKKAKYCMECIFRRSTNLIPHGYVAIEQEIIEIGIPFEELDEEEEIEFGRSKE